MVLMWFYAVAVTLPLSTFDGLGWSVKYHNCLFKSYQFDVYLYVVVCFSLVGLTIPVAITALNYILIIRKLKDTANRLRPTNASMTEARVSAKHTYPNLLRIIHSTKTGCKGNTH